MSRVRYTKPPSRCARRAQHTMTPEQRVEEWRYYTAQFQAIIDRTTDTPDGKRLAEIARQARDACKAEHRKALDALARKDTP